METESDPGRRLLLVLPLDVEGVQLVASRLASLPWLPPVGARIVVSRCGTARVAVDEVDLWLDGYAVARLEPWQADAGWLERLESSGWDVVPAPDMDAWLDELTR
jgi:hypothetical protein